MNWLPWRSMVAPTDSATMLHVHDLGRAELVDRFVQRLDAEVGLKRVRYLPGQNRPGKPVHDRRQIEEAFAHRQVGDAGARDLVGPVHPQPAEQIGVGLVPIGGLARVGLLVDRHQAHEAHQPPDAFLVHGMAYVLQVPGHLLHAEKRSFEKLLVHHHH